MKVRILHVLELSTAHSSRQLTTTLLKTLAMIKGSAQIPTIHNLALYMLLLGHTPRGRNPHMKGVGMLVVSLTGVNFGFWSHLGCSGQNAMMFSREGLV